MMTLALALVRFFEQRRTNARKAAGTASGLVPFAKGERFGYVPAELRRRKGRGIGVGLKGNWQGRAVLVFDLFHPAGKSVSMRTVPMTRFRDKSFAEFAAIEKNAKLYRPSVDLPVAADAPGELKKRWLLDARRGHWLFGAALAEWLGKNRGRDGWFSSDWSFEGHGTASYAYRRGTTAKPRRLAQWPDEALAEARELVRRAEAPAGDSAAEIEFAAPERDLLRVKTTLGVERRIEWTNSEH